MGPEQQIAQEVKFLRTISHLETDGIIAVRIRIKETSQRL
jgi:hypothetical protein